LKLGQSEYEAGMLPTRAGRSGRNYKINIPGEAFLLNFAVSETRVGGCAQVP